MVAASRYAVTTQERCSRPPRSPTIVGSAVETIVWPSEASSITSISPPITNATRGRGGAAVAMTRLLPVPPSPGNGEGADPFCTCGGREGADPFCTLQVSGGTRKVRSVVDPSLVAHHPEVGHQLYIRGSQRARLVEGMIQAVAEKGYAAATVADAVRAARVSRGTFYAQFSSKEECFLEAYRYGVDVLVGRIRAAIKDEPSEDWVA